MGRYVEDEDFGEENLMDDDYPDEEDWEREDREDAEWECPYPGECLMDFSLYHHSSECHTVEDVERYQREMQREGA